MALSALPSLAGSTGIPDLAAQYATQTRNRQRGEELAQAEAESRLAQQRDQLVGQQQQRGAAAERISVLGASAGLSRPAYEQYILQQQQLEAQGRESAAQRGRAEQAAQVERERSEADRRAAQSAQQALLKMQGEQQQAAMRLQQQLLAEQESRRVGRIPQLMGYVPGVNESPFVAPSVDEGEEAASQAAYTQARERAGSAGTSAVRALRELMAGQGLTGSTVESAGLGNIIGDTRGTVGEVARQQAMQRSQRAGQRADRDIAAGLTRRGQDVASRNALMQLILGNLY